MESPVPVKGTARERPMQQPVLRITFAVALLGGLALVTRGGTPDQPLSLPVPPSDPAMAPMQLTAPPSRPVLRFGDIGASMAVQPDVKEQAETGPELTLGECIAIAVERSPKLRAERASLAASESGYQALLKFGTVGTIISPDLDIRKQQAQRGLAAAAASYQKVHNDLVYDVTRLYYTAVYAKQQDGLATSVVDYLETMVKLVRVILDTTTDAKELQASGLNEGKWLTMRMGLAQAQEMQTTARIGRQQAMAALRQVMAVDESCSSFRPKDIELPLMDQAAPITKNKVVELALNQRPELALAAAGLDVFRLEVYAQGKLPFRRVVPTFASGADIHSKDIPQAIRTAKEYRPGGISPEMPTQLVGSKFDRVCRAMNFSEKADAIYQDARSLVTLDAENAYYEFELATRKLQFATQKFTDGKDLQKRTLAMAESVKQKDVLVQAYIVAVKAQADYVEAVYQHLLSLAALERITAGGICPAFPGR